MEKDKAMQIPALSRSVRIIANKVAALPVKLYKRDKDKVEEISDYRTQLLNAETGDTLDGNQFKKAMVMDYFLGKGGYAYVNWNGNKIESIHYIEERNVSFQENADLIFKNYEIMVQGQSYAPYMFIRFLRNTSDGIRGKSVLEENSRILSVSYNSLKDRKSVV